MARKRFNFWLDDKRSEDWKINELITTLKEGGQFTRAIREGLRLWADLRANKTDVLFELFPHLKPQVAGGQGGAGGSDLAKEIAAQIVLMGGTQGYVMQSTLPAPTVPKTTSAPKAQPVAAGVKVSADTIAASMLELFD